MKQLFFYMAVLAILLFQSFYLFFHDLGTWLINTWCIYGLLIVFFACRAANQVRGWKRDNREDKNNPI
jgi:hypothetical protein